MKQNENKVADNILKKFSFDVLVTPIFQSEFVFSSSKNNKFFTRKLSSKCNKSASFVITVD